MRAYVTSRSLGSSRIEWTALFFIFLTTLVGCTGGNGGRVDQGDEDPAVDSEVWDGDVVAATRALRPQEGTDRDWEIFRAMAARAWEEGVDTIPIGEAMVRIALPLVGTPYGPGTLEVAGQEDVVVNFQEFDCVTLVENVLALARFTRSFGPEILQSEGRTREAYRGALREIRYRNGRVDGYPSRLHYFSDWIRDNEAKGLVREVTQEMGGEQDHKAIDYMTTHHEAYRQLANTTYLMAIQQTEIRLSGLTRYKIPEADIATWISWIEDGDIIAATSTVEGLDVAHTGLAYWQNSELHLLHAPLVGEAVEVSSRPLAVRILRLDGQDGIRVVRPLDPLEEGEGSQGQ